MRPLELSLRNFRSFYGDNHRIDFRDRGLIGIVGPIGSGKSTILDAISFALYGKTPRIGSNTSTLIHQRAESAAVKLRFEVEGEIWEAARQIRRKGASQHALYRLPDDEPDSEAVEKVMMAGEVNSRIVELLGLDYEGFGRSVMLAQGQFAQFLSARPADRDKVLKGVFGYERVGLIRELAREALRTKESEIEKLDVRMEHVEEAKVRQRERKEELSATEQRLVTLEDAQPCFRELDERISKSADQLRQASERRDELAESENLPDIEESQARLQAASEAQATKQEADRLVAKAIARLGEAEELLSSEDFARRVKDLEEAKRLLVELRTQEEGADKAAGITTNQTEALGQAEQAEAAARSSEAAADSEYKEAEAAEPLAKRQMAKAVAHLEEVRHHDMAGTLREGLSSGDPCPVCDQPVHQVPPSTEGDLPGARQAVEKARSDQETAEQRLRQALGHLKAAQADTKAAVERVEAARLRLTEAQNEQGESERLVNECRKELRDRLGEGNPATLVEQEENEIEALRSEARQARTDVDEARMVQDAAREEERQTGAALAELRAGIMASAVLLKSDLVTPEADPQAISEALMTLHAGWSEEVAELERRIKEKAADCQAAQARLRDEQSKLGIEAPIGEAIAQVKTKRDLIADKIERADQFISGAVELLNQKKDLQKEVGLYVRLVRDLTDSRFVRFLLDEERITLAGLGSEHFERLSSERYRFTEDGKFDIIDLNSADAVRRADSLSGGETFLASLALALGLAEMVGRRGGRLDAFFLDEGFGTLDPEHVDLAMAGVESLAASRSQRLVVVVSHVRELWERIEDLIILEKDAITGDSTIKQGSGDDDS